MNSNNQNLPEDLNSIKKDAESVTNTTDLNTSTSATTNDIPEFGWSAYAERINGRFAMLGFISVLLVEAFSQESFLHWSGIMPL